MTIADTLSDAVKDINDYLADPLYDYYRGALRASIVAVVAQMDAVRQTIDEQDWNPKGESK